MVESLPADSGDMGSPPAPGVHMPQALSACATITDPAP